MQLLPISKLNTPINIGEIEQLINSEEAIADYIGLEDLTVKRKKKMGAERRKEVLAEVHPLLVQKLGMQVEVQQASRN